jgi:hypothetical protein
MPPGTDKTETQKTENTENGDDWNESPALNWIANLTAEKAPGEQGTRPTWTPEAVICTLARSRRLR